MQDFVRGEGGVVSTSTKRLPKGVWGRTPPRRGVALLSNHPLGLPLTRMDMTMDTLLAELGTLIKHVKCIYKRYL